MADARYIVGDVRDVLATLEPGSVDLVLSSFPFFGLRSYLPDGHPDKVLEIGSESTPGEFIDTLLDVVEGCERVLAPHGTLIFELGDSYQDSGGAGGDYGEGGLREGQPVFKRKRSTAKLLNGLDAVPMSKSLCLIPELFRISLVYGFNPLTGRQTPRWRARNVVRWCRPNPPVGALGDKFRPATSEMVVVCKSRGRYFDLDAVRTPAQQPEPAGDRSDRRDRVTIASEGRGDPAHHGANPAGAPPLDWWEIPTEPYKGAHYATWPTELLKRPIEAMCPRRVCRTCRQPSRRIVEHERTFDKIGPSAGRSQARTPKAGPMGADYEVTRTTLGWSDCGHDDWRPGHVLDCFGGSGSTAVVALGHGRDCTLVDLDERNADLARDRVGMWLTVEHHAPTPLVGD